MNQKFSKLIRKVKLISVQQIWLLMLLNFSSIVVLVNLVSGQAVIAVSRTSPVLSRKSYFISPPQLPLLPNQEGNFLNVLEYQEMCICQGNYTCLVSYYPMLLVLYINSGWEYLLPFPIFTKIHEEDRLTSSTYGIKWTYAISSFL